MVCLTKLGIRVGSVGIDGVLDGLVVGLDGDLALAGTALVLVVLEVAGGDLLGTHGCVVVVVYVGKVVMFGCMVEMIVEDGGGLCSTMRMQAVLMAFSCALLSWHSA